MWMKFRAFPWRAVWTVLRHGGPIVLDAAMLIEKSGLLNATYPGLDKALLVGVALADASTNHPKVVTALNLPEKIKDAL